MPGVRALPGGGVRVRVSLSERTLLRTLAAELEPILAGSEDVAGAAQRLYPRAYEDADAEAEYRDLVGDDLVGEHLAALATFRRTLEAGATGRLAWTSDLDADETAAWLTTVNNGRLVLGCALGITDERAWDDVGDIRDPKNMALHYLGWLQDELVAALAASLPSP